MKKNDNKKYKKPNVTEEVVELEDIIALSNQGEGSVEGGDSSDIEDLFPGIFG